MPIIWIINVKSIVLLKCLKRAEINVTTFMPSGTLFLQTWMLENSCDH